jgi:hypothetical protein
VSNAKTAGLSKDLGLVDNQFNLILTYYFIPFVLLGPVAGIATKRFTAKYTIPIMMLGFGSASCWNTMYLVHEGIQKDQGSRIR